MYQTSNKGKALSYQTERVAINVYSNLLRDFRTDLGNGFMKDAEHELRGDIKSFRQRNSVNCFDTSVMLFKRQSQMESLLKKFRFSTDAFTDHELSQKSLNGFLETQQRLHMPMPLRESGGRVLQRARLIAREILGDFPGDEVVNHVRFGRKSSIGCPLSLAFIDNKLSMKRAFTGTDSTSEFFLKQVLPGDSVLQRILSTHDFSELKEQMNMNHLNLVEVPKTWKAYRLITPLTLLGLFYSYGIGRLVTDRLEAAGLCIAKLQEKHRKFVIEFSKTLSHATADLSEASDSITSELLNRMLPRKWYNALKKTFVRQLDVDGVRYSTASVLPMGNGATFPVETLVFYCLIRAIGELSGNFNTVVYPYGSARIGTSANVRVKAVYSVYGDDLIYPSLIHKYVVEVFPQLHLKLNLEKTFVNQQFRESCGSDYYRGQDVRPYFMKGEACELSSSKYVSYLYKVYNGLIARWDVLEIRETLSWLLSEIAFVSGTIYRVPPSFPDSSGVKVDDPFSIPLSYNFLPWSPLLINFNRGSRWFQFDFLTETAKKRVVTMTEPYYWLALQGLDDTVVDDYGRTSYLQSDLQDAEIALPKGYRMRLLAEYIKEKKHLLEPPRSNLSWVKTVVKLRPFYSKGKKVTKRRNVYTPTVDSRVGTTVSVGTTKTDSISDWA